MSNYNSSQVGVPYVRAPRLIIGHPPPGSGNNATATIHQAEAVMLADGTSRELGALPALDCTFDLADQALIALVDPDTGAALAPEACAALGQLVASGNVTLQTVMLCLLAVVRREQLAHEEA